MSQAFPIPTADVSCGTDSSPPPPCPEIVHAVETTSATRRPVIVHFGPGPTSRGGITSVIKGYLSTPVLIAYERRWCPTQSDANWLAKAVAFLRALAKAPFIIRRADVIHVHTASRNSFYRKSLFVWLGWLLRKQVVLHIHGGGFGEFVADGSPWRRSYVRSVMSHVHRVICLTRSIADRLRYQGVREECDVVPNWVPVVSSYPRRYAEQPECILFAGWIENSKGVFDLIEAFSRVAFADGPLKLRLAGKGRLADCRRLAEQRGIGGQVELLGWLSRGDMDAAYRDAQIFCLPSHVEGLPMAMLEAMAHGLPIVATTVGGIPDVVSDHAEALLVPPRDVDRLEAALRQVLSSASLREKIGKASRARAESAFSEFAICRHVASIYQDLLGCDKQSTAAKGHE